MERIPSRTPEKKEGAKLDPRKALMMAIAAFNTAAGEPAFAAPHASRPEIGAWNTEVKESPAWFEHALAHPDAGNIPRLEAMLIRDAVPLTLQLRYLEHALGEGGTYLREFEAHETADERVSAIFSIVSRVSARLNAAYLRRNSLHAAPDIFKHVKVARKAARPFSVAIGNNMFRNCNAFLYRDQFGDVREETAAHCFEGADPVNSGFSLSDEGDAATRMLSQDEITKSRIHPEELPVLKPGMKDAEIFGHVIVSESFDPKDGYREKTFFSIAMPLTHRVQDFLGWHKQGAPYRKDRFFFMNPPSEAHLLSRDGDAVSVGASGSSGSLVSMAHGAETLVVGAMIEESIVEDSCTKLCYSLGMGNMPRIHEELAARTRNGPLIDEWAGDISAAIDALETAKHKASERANGER